MTYEYQCKKCGITTEVNSSMANKPRWVVCHECGGRCKSIVSASSFILSGNGWAGQDIKRGK